jgi:hypothetical protein
MPETPEPSLLPVPYRSTTLYVVDLDGHPYTPLQPIVEGMGLAWQPQHDKLQTIRERFCVSDIVLRMPGDDRHRRVRCIPLHKLCAWLMTIDHRKGKAPLRRKIATYQSECDDVLWSHWAEHRDSGSQVDHAPELLDALDNYTLASECFHEAATLFASIAFFANGDSAVLALARLGQERAECWRQLFDRQSEVVKSDVVKERPRLQ